MEIMSSFSSKVASSRFLSRSAVSSSLIASISALPRLDTSDCAKSLYASFGDKIVSFGVYTLSVVFTQPDVRPCEKSAVA